MDYKLSELFDLQMGKTPSRDNPAYWDSPQYAWISIADLTSAGKYITDTKESLSALAVEESGIKVIPAQTVVMSFKLSIGKVAITPGPMYSNEAIMAFVDKGIVKIDPEYLYYLLLHRDWEEGTNKAVMGKTLNKATLSNVMISIHSYEEQREIVLVLNRVSTIIDEYKLQLRTLDQLIKARFVEMFVGKGHPMIALDDLSLGKGEYGAQSASVAYDPKRPRYVRITDINDDGTLNDDVVSSANIEDDEQYRLTYGDFMFARMGATVGKTYAYKTGNQIFAGYLIRYRLNLSKITPEYLFAYTQLDEYKNWVVLNQSGAAQPGINAKKYGSLKIPVAPMDMQRAFQDFVSQVDKSKLSIQASLDQLETLKQSLMQRYFG